MIFGCNRNGRFVSGAENQCHRADQKNKMEKIKSAK